MTVNIYTPVPLSIGIGKRFTEAIIFLYCLVAVRFKQLITHEPDLEATTGKSSKDEFHCFVNKLGQICDSERGGDTITAFAVLQPGSIQYRFASNNRDRQSLEIVKRYITDILNTLGQTPDSRLDSIHQNVLGKVLAFNRPRIQIYIKNTQENFGFCIRACESEEDIGAKSVAKELRNLQQLVDFPTDKTDIQAFTTRTLALLTALNTLYFTPFQDYLRTKSRHDHEGPTTQTPWSSLRHALGRLHSYTIAVTVLISIRRRHHTIFEDFTVLPIPSSPPHPATPPPNIRRSAEGIARRMDNLNILPAYRRHAAYLTSIGLDEAIKSAAKDNSSIVHAEVNLADSIFVDPTGTSNPYPGEPVPFYGEGVFGRYIGCSKPTCRLCSLWFAGQPAGVTVRASHLNVYHRWRAPDVYEHQGEGPRRKREDNLEAMLKVVKGVVLEGLGGGEGGTGMGVVVRKAHDSWTSPSNPYPLRGGSEAETGGGVRVIGVDPVEHGVEGDDLVDRFGELGI